MVPEMFPEEKVLIREWASPCFVTEDTEAGLDGWRIRECVPESEENPGFRILLADVRPLTEERVFGEKLTLVSPIRREKIDHLRRSMDRCRSLAAGLLLREGILAAGLSYEGAELFIGEHGKPSLKLEKGDGDESERRFCYNLSHAGNYAAAVFSDTAAGIDIEEVARMRNPASLANRILTAHEKSCWERKSPQESDSSALTWIWTRKEAYAKEVGDGLGFDFSTIETLRGMPGARYWTASLAEGVWLSVCLLRDGGQILEPL